MAKVAELQARAELEKPYEATPEERSAVVAHLARKKERAPAPRIQLFEKGGAVHVSMDHPTHALGQALVMNALGTSCRPPQTHPTACP
jgi:hypothetical protein